MFDDEYPINSTRILSVGVFNILRTKYVLLPVHPITTELSCLIQMDRISYAAVIHWKVLLSVLSCDPYTHFGAKFTMDRCWVSGLVCRIILCSPFSVTMSR